MSNIPALILCCALSTPLFAQEPGLREQLSTRVTLNLPVARKILAAAEAEAERNGWRVCIALVDDAGRLICFHRMDGATNASAEIAIAKARHSANYLRDTKFHEDIGRGGNPLVLALPDAMPIEGGLRLMAGGVCVGAIGVSGVQSHQDGQIAKAGADLLAKP